MIDKFNQYINKNTICPYCLNNYLDMLKTNGVLESVDIENDKDLGVVVKSKTRHHRREMPRYNVDVRSMSILVPTHGCINSCKFCVSKISQLKDTYKDKSNEELFTEMYFKKFEQVRKMGCDYAILTGTGEPIQNKPFLKMIGEMNNRLDKPFKLEIQTSGVMLNDANLDFLKNDVGVYLISLSVSDIFDDKSNAGIIRMHPRVQFNMKDLCQRIKQKGFILRLSLNLVNVYDRKSPEEVINRLQELGVDQATFRVLWAGHDDSEISRWIKGNKVADRFIDDIEMYCLDRGKDLGGHYPKYQMGNLTVVIDRDCMAESSPGDIRYLILRSDCHLYTKWDSKNSIFHQ